MGQVITVASGKGGAGKTTIATGLAQVFCLQGYRTLVVDTDFGLCSAELISSGTEGIVYHIGDVATNAVSLEKAVVKTKGSPDFLAASAELLQDISAVAQVIEQASDLYDYVLVDRPAGLDVSLEGELSRYTCLIVSQPDAMGIRGAATACSMIKQAGCEKCYVVLNRFRPCMVKSKMAPDVDTICDTIGAQLMGIVPEDTHLFAQQAKGAFSLKTPYGKAIFRIASRIMGNFIPLPKLSKIMK